MNTREIDRLLKSDPACRQIFQGVFSVDTLPARPTLLVCNTDPSTEPGSHWIAIHVDSYGRGEYFDSFGRAPGREFKDYLDRYCRVWTFNNKQLQSVVSSFCGYYCCFYCMLRCRGRNMTSIVKCFTKDTGFNDSFVHSFVCSNK
jgi:hypothetical protein